MAKCLVRSKRLFPENLVPDKLSLKYQFWGAKKSHAYTEWIGPLEYKSL
jgi:hypothetical protein